MVIAIPAVTFATTKWSSPSRQWLSRADDDSLSSDLTQTIAGLVIVQQTLLEGDPPDRPRLVGERRKPT